MSNKYEPPYNVEEIKDKYEPNIADKLLNDPVHKWRAETGIELVHKEPTLDELQRIWSNWQLVDDKSKEISDEKSVEFFGITNREHYEKLNWGT